MQRKSCLIPSKTNTILAFFEKMSYHIPMNTQEHGNTLFPYNTYLCSIPLDFSEIPTHWHNEIELIYVKKGMGTITVDFRSYSIKAPALFFILPGQMHAISQYETERMEYENILFHPKLLYSAGADTTEQTFLRPLLQGKFQIPVLFVPEMENYKEVVSPIDACDEISRDKPTGYEIFIKGQLYLFFYRLISFYPNEVGKGKNRKHLEKIKPVIKYIEKNYSKRISIEEMASECGVSQAHFMRFFKDTIGMSFVTYLNHYRLTMAAKLLRGTTKSVLEISEEVGFSNLSHFNREFKKKYQFTPLSYRKLTSE